MPKGNNKAADGRALWQRARSPVLEALAAEAPRVNEAQLAAYLEGGLKDDACARIESALASRPEALDLLIAAREALKAAPAEAPERVVARAEGLAPARHRLARAWAVRLAGWPAAWLAALAGPLLKPGRGLAFAGFAAGVLVISAAGFELGRAEVIYSSQVDGLLAQEFAGFIGRDGEDLL